jgi:lysophospholipase L1-like esterase
VADRRTEPRTPPPIAVHGSVVRDPRVALLSRPALGAYLALALAAVLQVVPGLERWRLFGRTLGESPAPTPMAAAAGPEVGEARIESETRARPELAQPEQVKLPRAARGPIAARQPAADELRIGVEEPPVRIVDPEHRALAGFYRALRRTERRQESAITRILHFGDSIIVSDYVSGTLRRRFQRRFGDAGHGFMLLANPWPAYFHNDVYRFASSGWLVKRIVGPLASDGIYGLGCVSFRGPPGARARFGTARKGNYGRAVSRFELVYYQQPGGGKLRINLDGKPHSLLDTHSAQKRVATSVIRVPDGEHLLEVVAVEGFSRLFGVVMERDTPGVVLDALGIQGARARFLDKQDDEHWHQQLVWRKPALLIYQFGANESGDGFAYPMEEYLRTLVEVLRQGKQAVPEAGCLVIGAMDRASKRGTQLRSMAVIPHLVEQQRRAAEQAGCAFWNTYEAMGGPGSMAAWVQRGLGQADLTHPTGYGCEVLGKWVYRALMQGYVAYHRDVE